MSDSDTAPSGPVPSDSVPREGDPSDEVRQKLRQTFRAARREISHEQQQANAQAAAAHFAQSPLAQLGTTGVFMSQDGELGTHAVIDHCHHVGTAVALPVVDANKQMLFRTYTANQTLAPGAFGILEPVADAALVPAAQMALLLLPLVAFDARGSRLGMGGGFYDRYLGTVDPSQLPLLVGFCHAQQQSSDPLPTQPWDMPLDAVLTEDGITTFSARFSARAKVVQSSAPSETAETPNADTPKEKPH